MTIDRVAVIFDNQSRPETTGIYCLRALKSLVAIEHFLPSQLDRVPRQGFDLYLNIDDGHEYRLPSELRPCAWWVIDTHLNFDWDRKKAADFDQVFAAQRDGAEQLRQAGIASARWLPLACDPDLHAKHAVDKQFDLAFVGNLVSGPRSSLLALLREHFPNHFVGRCYFEDMARTYSAARLVFNRSIANDVNMRVFEALACGSLLLTNDLSANGQAELFQDSVHLATYHDAEELLDKARFYLKREDIRERIAAAGRAEALARHTYRHRMECLLHAVATDLVSTTVPTALSPAGSAENLDSVPALPVDARDRSYFEHARPELLALVPTSARKVLDVGCGSGRLGQTLKARQHVEVVGIEFNEEAAAVARSRLDRVLVGDVEQLQPDFPAEAFDAIICGDILEHLREPARFLQRALAWLQPQGQLIASIPNVRHHSVVRALLRGDWTYTPAGLLDRDHLRFFTRREIEKLFYRSGFTVTALQVIPGPGDTERRAQLPPDAVAVGGLHVRGLAPAEAEEFYTYQYLVCASPRPCVDYGRTSIVVLTHNQLEYTRLCVDSIREHTDEPYELLFVDNNSTDGTLDYLRSLPGVGLIANAQNLGFPAASNQGIRAATGRQIVLLNNDTVVTTGWLGRLLRALYSAPEIGLAGPCSNCVSGEQQVAASYDELEALDSFAWDWGKAHAGMRTDTDRLVGFCLLIRREVVEKIGLLDERFGMGCFEDDDYSRRALRAGYRAVITRDAFIHHFGGRTFMGAGVDYDALLRANRELYRQKWTEEEDKRAGVAAVATPRLPAATARPDQPHVLVIAHVGRLRDRMDKSHYYRYEALARRPGVTLFGPGLPGYRAGMSVREAVDVACGGILPDIILHGGDLKASGVPLVSGLADVQALTALELLDSWVAEDRQIDFIRRQHFAVGLIQEAGPHLAFYRQHCPQTEFFWTPNAVNTALFYNRGLTKDCDVLMYGEIAPEVYPLRARLAQLLARQNDLRFEHIRHPGYYPPPDTPAGRVIAGAELSQRINRSWIGIATRSAYHCLLMKHLEIPASYAVVAGDMPEHGRALFGDNFIELSMTQSDEDILTTLRRHLADKERLLAMTEAVHQRVMAEHSTEAFADKLLGTFREVLARRMGAANEATLSAPALATDRAPAPVAPLPVAPPAYGIQAAPSGGLLLVRRSIRLSLCMIVRDNAHTLEATLRGIRPWVDEMIVVDTGSTDATPRIAAQLGARVFHFPWCDSFAAARNESLRHARGAWVFWMDSDDTIDEANGRKLRQLVEAEADPSLLGYVMQVHCPGGGDEGDLHVTVVDHVKLFRNLPHLRFTGRIHEQILPAIRRSGGETAWTDIFVVHSGYDHSPEGQEKKKQRDLHLLRLELKEQPNHPFTLFNLGMTHADIGDYDPAVAFLRRSIHASGEGESHLRKAYALLVYCHLQSGQHDEAEETCRRALQLFPQDVELRFRWALLLHERGRLAEAVQVYRGVLEAGGERYFSSVDRSMRGFKGRQNLALVYADLGDWLQAEEQWRHVVAEAPRYRQGWRGLGGVLLRQGKFREVEELTGRLLTDTRLRVEGRLLQGQLAIARGDLTTARQHLQRAVAESADDPEPWQALCRFLFERGEPAEAAAALEELVRRDARDAAAWHNLGTVRMRLGQHSAAADAYSRSLALRPRSPGTLLSFGYALRDCGAIREAVEAWEQVLHLAPGQPESVEAQHEIQGTNERGSQLHGNGAAADVSRRGTAGAGGRTYRQLGAGTPGPASG